MKSKSPLVSASLSDLPTRAAIYRAPGRRLRDHPRTSTIPHRNHCPGATGRRAFSRHRLKAVPDPSLARDDQRASRRANDWVRACEQSRDYFSFTFVLHSIALMSIPPRNEPFARYSTAGRTYLMGNVMHVQKRAEFACARWKSTRGARHEGHKRHWEAHPSQLWLTLSSGMLGRHYNHAIHIAILHSGCHILSFNSTCKRRRLAGPGEDR